MPNSSEEDKSQKVQAEDNSLAVGDIRVGGSAGNINISNVTHIYSTAKEDSSPRQEEPVAGDSPYMGLRYFDTSDVDLFHGRAALTAELLRRVKSESFLAIVGASGSGKSSVARAGLIPAWKKENERSAIHILTPTAHPLESLAASLTSDSESVTATATLMDDMNKDSRSLRLYVKKSLGETKLFLLVDQFEENFTLCKEPAERKAFIENLLSLADDDSAARVVITLRADFYHHCAEFEGLRNALKTHQEYIGAMTADELRQAITAPAQSAGWDFQPGLVDLILQDVGTEPGALPLLSHALLETWKRRQGRTLTLQGYAEAGGVKKAITQTAEGVYDKLSPAEQTIARGIFLRLTELGEGVQDTRRRVKMDELGQSKEQDAVAKVLKTLTDARLVTTEEDSAEVAHEALIREWGTLRKWLDEDRDSLRLHRHLTESAMEWVRRGKEAEELYRGTRLKQIQEWMREHKSQLSSLEAEFVKTSQGTKNREQLRGAIFVFIIIAVFIYSITFAVSGKFNSFYFIPVDMKDYWVTIPAGEFQMGSSDEQIAVVLKTCSGCNLSGEQPQHLVYLSAFQIGKYEVTNRQYAQCVRAGVCAGSIFTYEYYQEIGPLPVNTVNWHDAETYCEWVGGRLPTEAEWEKAARGGLESKLYPWGDEAPACTKGAPNGANFFGGYGCPNDVTAVGSYSANEYGLYDMVGNVQEWTSSLDQPYPYDSSDGREDMNSSNDRVIRGGSWIDIVDFARSASRNWNNPVTANLFIGFRCARSPEEQ